MGKRVLKVLIYLLECLYSILFPISEECIICKQYSGENYICLDCEKKIKLNFYLKYTLENNKKINIFSIGYYNGTLKEIILRLKYNSDFECASVIARYIKDIINLQNLKFDYITFVPSERKKMKIRGFNQTKVIALNLSKLTNIEIIDILKKDDNVKDQIGLNIENRWDNLKYAFEMKAECRDKNILLIDDVYTSGATVFIAQNY